MKISKEWIRRVAIANMNWKYGSDHKNNRFTLLSYIDEDELSEAEGMIEIVLQAKPELCLQ